MIIHGAVTDPSGQPVPGAVVMVAAAPVPVPDIAALTDAEGRFSIIVPAPGSYRLLVRGAHASSEILVACGEEDRELAVRLAE